MYRSNTSLTVDAPLPRWSAFGSIPWATRPASRFASRRAVSGVQDVIPSAATVPWRPILTCLRTRAFADRFAAQRAAGTQFRHMVSNIAVTITGNRAAASAYLLVLISKDGNHRSLPPGRYTCELIKEDSGQWRFSRRIVFHDCDYTLDGIGR